MKLVSCEPELFKICIEAGADVNAHDDSGNTVLMYAVEPGYDNSVKIKFLLEHGADIEAIVGEVFTVLMASIMRTKCVENMQTLIHAGTSVNATNAYSATPLMLAVVYRNIDYVRILLEAGADVNAIDNEGLSVVDLARTWEKQGLVKILVKAGASDL